MKTKLHLTLAFFTILIGLNLQAQRGKNGSFTVTGASEVLNRYTSLTSNAVAGATVLNVGSTTITGPAFGGAPIQQGDLVMIIQMHGAAVDINNFPVLSGWGPYTWPNSYFSIGFGANPETFGQVTAYNSAGRFERAEVLTASGTQITLTCGLTYTYSANDEVQVVRIPRFDDLTVNNGAAIVPELWDGATGGIVALEVDGTLTINSGGTISAAGFGFRGGELDNDFTPGLASTGGSGADRFLGSPSGFEGSEKGESIRGYHTEYDAQDSRYGVAPIANGGGGGGFVNSGGGGGSNAEVAAGAFNAHGNPVPGFAAAYAQDPLITASSGGGQGGYALSQSNQNAGTLGPNQGAWSGDGRKNAGGWGAHPLAYNSGRIFFGGGGGAGDQDSGQGGAGGRGGGIVYIVNYGTVVGGGEIDVNGEAGQNSNPNNLPLGFNAYRGNDGAGGGGGAGTVYIENATAIPNTININAIGGDGGDQNLQVNTFQPNEAGGPGGAGSGGIIRFSSGAPAQSVVSGDAGVTTSTHLSEFPPNGATLGSSGDANLPAPYFDLIPNDVSICLGQSATPSVTVQGSYSGTLNWYNSQYGGAPIAGQTNQLTYNVSPGATTTYWVGVCPGTFRVPVTVTVTSAPNLITTDPAPVCAPNLADITLPAVTAGSDAGTLSYWQDNGATITQGAPAAVGAGWHYIQLDAGGGCTTLDSVFVTVNPLDDASFTTGDFCEGSANTVSAVATPGGTFTIQSQTGSGAVTIDGGTGILSNGVAGDQVVIEYTTAGPCPNSSTQTVNIVPSDDASFSSGDFCASSVNTISAVVTPGGTFSIASQTGSGGVTINPSTGILSNYFAGDQVTIQYTTPAGPCQTSSTVVVNVTSADDASFTTGDFCVSGVNTVSGIVTPGGTFAIVAQTGSGGVTIAPGTGLLSNYLAGDQVTIEYTTPAGGCQNSSQVVVNALGLDDASFTSGDYCFGGANTISGVVTPGGTFAIASQTGSGSVTIAGGTGILSGGAAGDQVTIEYTTPAGGCPNTSTQVVNLLPLDDASFVTNDFCVSSVNIISGVATPGGTFSIVSQTGSGGITIAPGTGILSNYFAGDQVTIEYTTAGACPNSSQVVVNVTNLDDASFTSGDFCVSGVNTVSGIATPGGTFSISAQTGSGGVTIAPGTGILSNYFAGDQVTIEYTTPAGGCQNSSQVVVNVLNLDDASFTSGDYCVGGSNSISGVATPGGTFTIQSQTGSGGVTIAAGTGILSNGVAGDQVTIEYTTPAGGCQNSSTQVVNVLSLDDATFISSDFCASTVNTISGVVTPGGTFSIASQTGSGGVTIASGTGILSNYFAGDQVTIQYTTVGTCPNSSQVVVNVLNSDNASFNYSAPAYCVDAADPTPTITGLGGGTFSSTAGLSLASGTGTIDVSASTPGTYTVTYTTAGSCPNSSNVSVTINAQDDASFNYAAASYCLNGSDPTPTITGLAGGSFSSTAGLSLNAASGVIDLSASTPGTYTVTYTTAGACPNSSDVSVTISTLDDASFISSDFCITGTNTISGIVTAGGTFSIQSQTGSGAATINSATGILSGFAAGDQIVIEYTTPAGGCQNSSTQTVNVNSLDDASFVSSDFCVSSVNVISGVMTPGGTFTIQSQTGSGGVTIDASTGVLSGFAAGDQVTIEYTTPAGGCPNSSTQVVNVIPSDDASFTSVDFCAAGTNTISGVATPGGTFTIQSQTGSGGATIDPTTGILSGFAAGDQIIIEYTTPAGGCQNSSTQTVNVTSLDDASFASADFCASSTNAISGVITPGGSFTILSQTGSGGATIDGVTGILSGFAAGDQVTIEYTTPAGGCQNSSTQVVNVLNLDDASFNYAANAYCVNDVNPIPVVTGLPGGVFSSTAGLTLNAGTGEIDLGVSAQGTYSVTYTTTGTCPNTASVSVTINQLDDASFTLTPTCDGALATISGTTGGGFALISASSATIDPTTGTVTGAAYNEVIDVEYTTTGACPNSSLEMVVVDDCTPIDLIIPTAFTPSADGVHDQWEIVGLDNLYPNNRVLVYNRWGNKVFEHNSNPSNPYSNNMWDGTFNGQQLPVASYYYIIEPNDGGDQKYEGTVTILQ